MTATSSARRSRTCSRRSRGFELVAICEDGESLLAAIEAERPDVVLTDIRMPPSGDDEGIMVANRLRVTHPEMGVVVVSQYADPRYGLALLEGGSDRRAYLLKERLHDRGQLVGGARRGRRAAARWSIPRWSRR